ncbi:multidrug effflux MFS transporter [Chitinophaga defluvii]|uniref:Multidrug effflux MFS transporter n=1 Tax=Chitinophaga defluvii TaxID=3163343 RepID=A0ABV2T305_9BACT
MKNIIIAPPFWLLVILIGFPQISETIYTPALPQLAEHLHTSGNWMQASLSIYFAGFALGGLLWGRLADQQGRRPAMLYGVGLFIIGSAGCLLAPAIHWFLVSRFVQAAGAAAGQVVTQTVLLDCFTDTRRARVFAAMFAVLAFSPALGPLMGGFITQYLGVAAVFLTLILLGAVIVTATFYKLGETRPPAIVSHQPLRVTAGKMLRDPHIWITGAWIGIMNGIVFSFYGEAPFIFIHHFGFTSSQYGFIGICEASSAFVGAMFNRHLMKRYSGPAIIRMGIGVMLSGSMVLTVISQLPLPPVWFISGFVCSIFVIFCGSGMALPHCLSNALTHYEDALGRAGAILMLYYYIVIGMVTGIMSWLHSDQLTVLPVFFLVLTSIMWLLSRMQIKQQPG